MGGGGGLCFVSQFIINISNEKNILKHIYIVSKTSSGPPYEKILEILKVQRTDRYCRVECRANVLCTNPEPMRKCVEATERLPRISSRGSGERNSNS